jgi:TRAP-type C4-dicarboxylate transport system permease small subunit
MRGVLERVLALALLGTIVLNFANVVDRYVLGRTLVGADEVQTYAMVWIAFLGAGLVAWHGEHLRMDVLWRFYPPALQRAVRVAEGVLVLLVVGFALVQSLRYAASMWQFGARSPTAGIPMWIAHSGLALGLALILLAGARRLMGGKA